jgi:DNA primase
MSAQERAEWEWRELDEELACRRHVEVIRDTRPGGRDFVSLADALAHEPRMFERVTLEVQEVRFNVDGQLDHIARCRRVIEDAQPEVNSEAMVSLLGHLLEDVRGLTEYERWERQQRARDYPYTREQADALQALDIAEREARAQRRVFVAVDRVARVVYSHPLVESPHRRSEILRLLCAEPAEPGLYIND